MDILEVDFCNRVAQCGFSSGDFVGSVMTLGAKMAMFLQTPITTRPCNANRGMILFSLYAGAFLD